MAAVPAAATVPQLTVLPSPAAPAPEAAAPKRRKKLDLGGVAATTSTTTATKVYPRAELTDEQREMVSLLLVQTQQFKALEGTIESMKKDVNALVLPQWFKVAQGNLEPPSSIIVPGKGSDEGMLVVAGDTGGRYTGTAEEAYVDKLAEVVGEELFDTTFTEKVTFKMEIDKVAEDQQQPLIHALLKVCAEHGASHAVTAKTLTTFQPLARKARYQMFTLEQNLAIHAVLPIVPSFKRRA